MGISECAGICVISGACFGILWTVCGIRDDMKAGSATVELSVKQDRFYHQPLINALIQVESNGDPNEVGDKGKAVGVLQLHKVYVDDANRILGEDRYGYDDRKDPAKSIEMFLIVSDHYADHYQDWSDQGRARRHNGGPTGHLKDATLGYWKKVEEVLGQ